MDNTTDTVETDEVTVETEAKVDAEIEIEVEAEDNVEVLEAKVEEKPAEDFKEKYYYLAAEMQNMQRRFDKEKDNLHKYGSEKIIRDMLDVVDNLERTLNFIRPDKDEKIKNIVVGIEMIEKMFIESLGKHGLKQIDALGETFDPHFHEALAQQPDEGKENNTILQVHQNGYALSDRVIRAAKVIIVKND